MIVFVNEEGTSDSVLTNNFRHHSTEFQPTEPLSVSPNIRDPWMKYFEWGREGRDDRVEMSDSVLESEL